MATLFREKVVILGERRGGHEATELVRRGAGKVIGVNIREEILAVARRNAEKAGVTGACEFTSKPATKADVIVSIDAFEHFAGPAEILRITASVMQPDGSDSLGYKRDFKQRRPEAERPLGRGVRTK